MNFKPKINIPSFSNSKESKMANQQPFLPNLQWTGSLNLPMFSSLLATLPTVLQARLTSLNLIKVFLLSLGRFFERVKTLFPLSVNFTSLLSNSENSFKRIFKMNILFYEDDVLMLKWKILKIAKKNFQNGQLFIISEAH